MTPEQMVRQYLSKKIEIGSNIMALPVDRNTRDIFVGDGWTSHSRYRRIRGALIHISGTKLPNVIVNKVFQ